MELAALTEQSRPQNTTPCSPELVAMSVVVKSASSTFHSDVGLVPVALFQSNTNSSSSYKEDPVKGSTEPNEIIHFHATTSMSDFPTVSHSARRDEGEFNKIDAKTSTPSIQPCFYPGVNFYHRLDTLERHEANHHFDNGKILTYDLRNFRIMIGKFVCAFLNTSGGTLYFGVTKAGKIIGLQLDHKNEDAIRVDIDSQVKEIKPTVPTSGYYINFAKVMDNEGKIINDLKILEVKVRPHVREDWYYTYKSVTYVWSCSTANVYRPEPLHTNDLL